MATVLIRNLSEDTKARLEAQAAAKARGLEAELRDILDKTALENASPDDLEPIGSWLVRLTRPGFDDAVEAIEASKLAPQRTYVTFD